MKLLVPVVSYVAGTCMAQIGETFEGENFCEFCGFVAIHDKFFTWVVLVG